MRWKWMTRKIFLDKGIGAAGDCRPSSKMMEKEWFFGEGNLERYSRL